MRHPSTLVVALALASPACSTQEPAGPRGSVRIQSAPLSLPGIVDACYGLTVTTPGGDTVVSLTSVCAHQYGSPTGDISYVAPCDASFGTNTVSLVLESLTDSTGPVDPTTYINPCGDPAVAPTSAAYNYDGFGPCQQTVTCTENADTSVVFDLTVMRSAKQGFFDVAVNFEDIFCSAKVDCANPDTGAPLELLFAPGGTERIPTVVVAFACTTGAANGTGPGTTLDLTDLTLTCAGEAPIALDLAGPDGNQFSATSPAPSPLLQAALYRDVEDLVDASTGVKAGKLFENVALGFDLSGAAKSCHLSLTGTASPGPLTGCATDPTAVYPVIRYDLDLTTASGTAFACTQHPLDANPGHDVFTSYATSSTAFTTTITASGSEATAAPCDGGTGGGGTGGGSGGTGTLHGVVYYERHQNFMNTLPEGRPLFYDGQPDGCVDLNAGGADVNCWSLFGFDPPADQPWYVVHQGLTAAANPVITVTGSGGTTATTTLTGTTLDYTFAALPTDETYCVRWENAGTLEIGDSRWPSEPAVALFETPAVSAGAADWRGRALEQCGLHVTTGGTTEQDFGMVHYDGPFGVTPTGTLAATFYFEGMYAAKPTTPTWPIEWFDWNNPGYQADDDGANPAFSCDPSSPTASTCDTLVGPSLAGITPGLGLLEVDLYEDVGGAEGDWVTTITWPVSPTGATYTEPTVPVGTFCVSWWNPPGAINVDSTNFPEGGDDYWSPSILGVTLWPSEPYVQFTGDASGPDPSWDGSPIEHCGVTITRGATTPVGFGFVFHD